MLIIKRPTDGHWLNLSQAKTLMPTLEGDGILAHMGGGTTFRISNLTLEELEDSTLVHFRMFLVMHRDWQPFDSYLSPRDRAGNEPEERDEREKELF